jgi:hypothetical protein
VNRRFGGTYHFHFQDSSSPPPHAGSSLTDFSSLKMEAVRSSETSIHTSSTWRNSPEDGVPYEMVERNFELPVDLVPLGVYYFLSSEYSNRSLEGTRQGVKEQMTYVSIF